LGEKPSPSIGNEVQGVVLEFPIESSEYKDNWVDTLAAYSDSRARYLNGKTGTGIIWEAPEEPRVNSLVMSVMNAAKPLVEETPIFEKQVLSLILLDEVAKS
jgi:hypothetical protein